MTANEGTKTQFTRPSDRELVVTRVFDAPRDLVWKAWTEAEHLKHWWGPEGWTLPVSEMDFRPGGSWLYCMKGPESMDGMESWGKTMYDTIDVPNSFTGRDVFVDSDGNAIEGMPVASMTVEFIDQDGKTLVKSTTVYPTKEDLDKVIEMGMEEGFSQTLDRLEALLKGL